MPTVGIQKIHVHSIRKCSIRVVMYTAFWYHGPTVIEYWKVYLYAVGVAAQLYVHMYLVLVPTHTHAYI